jgi:hypothetical protein
MEKHATKPIEITLKKPKIISIFHRIALQSRFMFKETRIASLSCCPGHPQEVEQESPIFAGKATCPSDEALNESVPPPRQFVYIPNGNRQGLRLGTACGGDSCASPSAPKSSLQSKKQFGLSLEIARIGPEVDHELCEKSTPVAHRLPVT